MSSIFCGKTLRLSIFGESHAAAVGMTLDGLPAGLAVDMEELQAFLKRRAPGQNEWSTPRKEEDMPEFLCGLKNGHTCGTPLTAIIRNKNTRSGDYADLRTRPRPGHADYTAELRYHGFQDPAGGGHFSGRMTAALCIAGGILLQELERRNIPITARICRLAGIDDEPSVFPMEREPGGGIRLKTPGQLFPVFSAERGEAMRNAIAEAKNDGDSVGGVIECVAANVPGGLGDPMFDGIENRIAQLVFAVPAVKGIEFGSGFGAADMRGSENNDAFVFHNGAVCTETNNSGGILGGITSGMPVVFRAAFKPTPSIARPQRTVNMETGEEESLSIRGRHDPCIVPRAVPVIEAVTAIAIADFVLAGE
ncbi:MAG: chorismate synthase [Oscillospiraceae bacterium]|nr:chorismate synthase [Oscillospiraceae bacterium]